MGSSFLWNNERRFNIRCELDAAYFHLYEVNYDEVDHILETFPVVKRREIQKYGQFRTKRVILECYDSMAEAMKTGSTYQTILDPPPGPPEKELAEWKPGHPKPKDWPSHIHALKEVER